MVSIDRVYQKVLALANKEQRGYITPQEFNLFADHAQMEIFEQYFYDINQFRRVPGNNHEFSDPLKNLEQKISIFEKYDQQYTPLNDFGDIIIPSVTTVGVIYRLGMIRVRYKNQPNPILAEKIQLRQLMTYMQSPLTEASKNLLAYYIENPQHLTGSGIIDRIKIYPYPSTDNSVDQVLISYILKPTPPKWAYIILNDKPLYNSNNSTDFELHESEETELVYRILALAGVSIEKPQLTQIGAQLTSAQIQQEKS
tara:strand:- start:18568 stop:19332 length:765 start_codon:yes stop_codon:yes gene_type:complete